MRRPAGAGALVAIPAAMVVGVVIALVQRVRRLSGRGRRCAELLSGGIVDKQRCPPQDGRMAAGCGRGVAVGAAGLFPSSAASVLLAVLAAVQAAGLIRWG